MYAMFENYGELIIMEYARSVRGDEPQKADEVDSTGRDTKAALATVSGRRKPLSEEADDYPFVVAVLNAQWRLIECRDRIQWILQKRGGSNNGKPRWRSRKWCRSKVGLMRSLRDERVVPSPAAQAIIGHLPDDVGKTA